MALTYGFYNSIEGDRVYDAIQFGRIFDGIIKDGVYATYEKGMMVIASENPSEVIIQPGRAWFNHTWSYNDANVIFEAPAPEVLLERYDALVLEINEELSARENSFKWVTGTPSSRPERPTLTNTTTIHQYPLCYVHRYPETTMIYTRDITNMIGTSECPFVTGVLEGIDLDAWINQWDDEFHNWENSKKTQFEAWMLSQETTFTTWYNAFKDQMAADVQEVEDFVDYLESVLDASTAIHLQEEIDELRDEISSGSYITVTTINPELYGRNVTITESGGTVFTEKFDNTGVAVFKSVPYVGNLTISSTYGTQTAERVVNTPYYARYEFAIAFWAATVNIVGDPEMAGSSVTVKDSEEAIVGTVVLDSEGTGVYTAIKPDTYKFTLTYGGETMEVTLSVTQETTYTVDLHAADFKWQDWLEAGGVTGSYSSLDDVLADEVALRRLFTVHASVDYLASISDENEDVEKVINTDLAAKWINLRDYALDTLHANTYIAAYMDTADKYGYGEWALMPQVPKMTSNSAPYGTVSASGTGASGHDWYMAFDGNIDTYTRIDSPGSTPYLEYTFVSPVIAKKCMFFLGTSPTYAAEATYTIQGYDGTSWHDLGTKTATSGEQIVDLTNSTAYSKYRLSASNPNWKTSTSSTTATSFLVGELQFYAWAPKGNVPVMTTNTTPYGTITVSGTRSGSYPYYAFDGNMATQWQAPDNSQANSWMQYEFTNPICVKEMEFGSSATNTSGMQPYKGSLYGSNDGSTWGDPLVSITFESTTGLPQRFKVENNQYYKFYRLQTTQPQITGGNARALIHTLQFYGRELSDLVPPMISNTAPYGTVSASSAQSGYEAYKAFNKEAGSNQWRNNNWNSNVPAGGEYVQYTFDKPVSIKYLYYIASGVGGAEYPTKVAYQYYDNSDNTWKDLYRSATILKVNSEALNVPLTDEVETDKIRAISYAYNNYVIQRMTVFGKDYSEKEFEEGTNKKWLYDHGLELETIESYWNKSGTSMEKKGSSIKAIISGSYDTYIGVGATLDLTSYDLARVRINESNGYPSMRIVTTALAYVAEVVTSANNLPNNVGLDISSINGQNIVCGLFFGNVTASAEMTELWLE